MAWTTADLLTTVKNRAMIPDASSGSLSSPALLQFATEELLITIVPMIMSVREKFYETYLDTAVTAGMTTIPIPARAVGGVLSAVQYIYGTDIRQMQPIDPASATSTQSASYPTNYYFQNNSIVLYPPAVSAQGTIRMRYFQRPSRLEQTSNCGQITAFDTVAKTVTLNAAPSTWVTSNQVDFIPQTASQATPYGLNSAITGVASNVLTFAALPSAIATGDWVALSEYTPIPEVPFEFQAVLAQATVCKALEALNAQSALAAATTKLGAYQKAAVLMLTPRDQEGTKKVVSAWRRL